MTVPKTTIWPLEPHTLAKHAILRNYLAAWFPILASAKRRIVYFDGFAGPGRYSKGEDGSPLIALKAALGHRGLAGSEIAFVFVEQDKDRAGWLLHEELPKLVIPKNFKVEVVHSEFAPILKTTLDKLDHLGHRIAPTFAFIDPFGITGLPFELIERLLRRKSCEVLITFMTETVRRFVSELGPQVNELIGDSGAADEIARATDRVAAARRIYERSLRRVVPFVRFFQLRDVDRRPIYDLFFATGDALGHEKMKEAMWKVDESGAYSFADSTDPDQTILFTASPGADVVPLLSIQFSGTEVDSEDVFRYTLDRTPYLKKHAGSALKILEDDGRIQVDPLKSDGSRRKRGTFPSGTRVRFPNYTGDPL